MNRLSGLSTLPGEAARVFDAAIPIRTVGISSTLPGMRANRLAGIQVRATIMADRIDTAAKRVRASRPVLLVGKTPRELARHASIFRHLSKFNRRNDP